MTIQFVRKRTICETCFRVSADHRRRDRGLFPRDRRRATRSERQADDGSGVRRGGDEESEILATEVDDARVRRSRFQAETRRRVLRAIHPSGFRSATAGRRRFRGRAVRGPGERESRIPRARARRLKGPFAHVRSASPVRAFPAHCDRNEKCRR